MADSPPQADSPGDGPGPGPMVRGLVVPMVTPIKHGRPDPEGIAAVVRFLIEGGVDGLFIAGTTGEGPSLPRQDRRALIEETVHAMNRSAPVARARARLVVNISTNAWEDMLCLAEEAADWGADAVALTAPGYFPLDDDEIRGYFTRAIANIPLPVMLYNMPSHSRVSLPLAMVAELAGDDRVIGVKDSGGDIAYHERLLAIKRSRPGPDFAVLTGPVETLACNLLGGGDGGVLGTGHLAPQRCRAAIDAAERGDAEAARLAIADHTRIQRQIIEAVASANRWTMAIKRVMARMGLCEEEVLPPLRPCTDGEREAVDRGARELDLVEPANAVPSGRAGS